MTIVLSDGSRVVVRPSGAVELQKDGRTFRSNGSGSYAKTVQALRNSAYGQDVKYIRN
jgi:hypothetical protein